MSLFIFSFDYGKGLLASALPVWRRVVAMLLMLVLVLVGGMYVLRAVFYFDNFQVKAVKALSARTEVVGLGSSRMFFGIDPRSMPGQYMTLAANYLDMSGADRLWSMYGERLPRVKLVVIEFGMSTLYYDMRQLSPQALQPLGLDVSPEPRDFIFRPDYALRLLLSPIFRWRLTPEFFNTSRAMTQDPDEPQAEVAGHVPSKLKLVQPQLYAERKVAQSREHLTKFPKEIFERNYSALQRLVRRLDERRIRTLFVRFPKERHVWPLYDPSWDHMVKNAHLALSSTTGTRDFLDLSRDDRFLTEDFRDPDHLNRDGARKLSELLRAIIAGDLSP